MTKSIEEQLAEANAKILMLQNLNAQVNGALYNANTRIEVWQESYRVLQKDNRQLIATLEKNNIELPEEPVS